MSKNGGHVEYVVMCHNGDENLRNVLKIEKYGCWCEGALFG